MPGVSATALTSSLFVHISITIERVLILLLIRDNRFYERRFYFSKIVRRTNHGSF